MMMNDRDPVMVDLERYLDTLEEDYMLTLLMPHVNVLSI
jgi:hypothetical protein